MLQQWIKSSSSSSKMADGALGSVNRAVIVSVGHFHPGVQLTNRPGAQRDTKRLHKTLCKMGFKVDIHSDLDSHEIYELFDKESRRTVRDCFLAVISSHGDEGVVFGADGGAVRLAAIFNCFNNREMEGKTKVFLIQACRGSDVDDGVEVDSILREEEEESFSHHLSVPIDTAVMYATPPGYGAFMHPLGSVFLQTFCDLLEEKSGRDLEITRLMTRLSHRVAFDFEAKGKIFGGKKEMPCFMSRLTKEVFPFTLQQQETVTVTDRDRVTGSGTAKKEGISATQLVDVGDFVRKRTPSIS